MQRAQSIWDIEVSFCCLSLLTAAKTDSSNFGTGYTSSWKTCRTNSCTSSRSRHAFGMVSIFALRLFTEPRQQAETIKVSRSTIQSRKEEPQQPDSRRTERSRRERTRIGTLSKRFSESTDESCRIEEDGVPSFSIDYSSSGSSDFDSDGRESFVFAGIGRCQPDQV